MLNLLYTLINVFYAAINKKKPLEEAKLFAFHNTRCFKIEKVCVNFLSKHTRLNIPKHTGYEYIDILIFEYFGYFFSEGMSGLDFRLIAPTTIPWRQ